MSWTPCQNCKLAVGIWNFDGDGKYHLTICVGDLVVVLEELEGWYRGYLYHYPSKMGIFPRNHVQSIEYNLVSAGEEDYCVPQIDPVAMEAKECIYLWKEKLFEYFVNCKRQNYVQILNYMEDVLHWRGTLVRSNVTHDKLQDMKTRLSAKIDLVNSLCGLPLTVRDNNGHVIDPQLTSIQKLYSTHKLRQSEVERKVPQTGWDQKKNKDPVTSQAHHLYLVVRHISHHFPEDSEVFMFLFDGENKKQISERFLINVPKGSSESSSQNNRPIQHYCIFTDLGAKEMQSNSLYLVCKVIRKGKMLLDDKKNVSNYPYRRPYAVGVLDLRAALDESNRQQLDDDDDYQMTYTMSLQICITHEQDFGTLHLSQIKKSGPKASGGKQGILLSTALKFIRGDLQQLRKDFPYLINKNAVLVDKLGFPDVILPGVVRNDIYITLEYGLFEKGSKRAERNVEVAIAVCDKNGSIVPGCIIPAAGADPLSEYESFIYYHHNQPKWHETFKLSIPYGDIPRCHLRIGFRHVAKNEGKDKMDKTFAFSHLKIMREDGAIFPDGTHELFVYKADNKKWHDPNVYLAVQSAKEMSIQGTIQPKDRTTNRGKTFSTISLEGSLAGQSVGRSQRETIYITTLTCSTKLTQKVEMLSLLKWRQQYPRNLQNVISKVHHIDGGEIVKFLQDTLDSLFDILADNPTYGECVFDALVSIFNLLSNERYKHFKPVLDIYVAKHFSAAHAYKTLLWQFDKRLKEGDTGKSLLPLVDVVKSLKFLFDFIIQSYSLYSSRQADSGFHQSLDSCFDSMCSLLRSPESRYHGIHSVQAALLRAIPSVLPRLTEVYTKRQLAGIISKLIDSVQNDHPALPGEKMSFILAVINSDINLCHPQDSRAILFPTIVSHMISNITNKMPDNGYRSDEPGNIGCIQCIAKVLDILHTGEELYINFTDIENATPLLMPLLQLSKTLLETSNPLKGESYLNLVGLLKVMSESHYAIFLDSLKSVETEKRSNGEGILRKFICDLLKVLEISVTKAQFPSHWVYLHLTLNSILMKVLTQVSFALFSSFFEDTDYIPQIWDIYFCMCKHFITQKCLQLENYSDILRAKLIRQQVSAMWHRLEDKKANFIPNLIGLFLEISLLKETQLRRVAIPLIFDIVKFERKCHNNFKRVEAEVFDKMDYLVSQNCGDEAYRDLFQEIMTHLCYEDEHMKETGKVFVDSVSHLIGLILDYRNVQGDNNYRGQRMGCILNLLNFYKEIEKEELYIRYIYKLAELHEHDANFAEAGLTLLLHAKTLSWTNELVPSVPGVPKYPTETAAKRKERLYNDAIRLLNEGKSWEYGIPLCKEIAQVYETQQYNYQKLSEILRTQADFFSKIMTELRVENEYFVVGYYGRGFPLLLRNKICIHRGQPYERLQAFLKRLTDEFLSAQIYMAAEAPGDDIQNSNGMYLQVRKVLPVPEERKEFANADVKISDKITDYYKTNNVCKFRYDRPFHKGKKDPECEFATLCIERTSYTTANSFPGVINWFEVCEMKTEELNPLDIARETISSKVNEIQKLTNEVVSDSSMNVNPLSMLLNGVIDAAVMGGIANYDKIFFQPKYVQEHPDHKEGVNELHQLIKQQVEVLKKALAVHGQRVPPDLKAFHENLETKFEKFQDTVDPERKKHTPSLTRKDVTLRPLPPTPTDTNIHYSQPKIPHRRGSGGNPSRMSCNLEATSSNNKIKRSQTTRGPRQSSFIGSPERQSLYSSEERSQSISSSSMRDSAVEEDRGLYEVVDLHSSPAPNYPPPPLPNDRPKVEYPPYAFIDMEDDDDYEPVKPGGRNKKDSIRRNPEFASPNILRGLPLSQSKSPSESPPRRRSLFSSGSSKMRSSTQVSSSPPSSPTESHLIPLTFTKFKSPSPSSISTDEEPLLDSLDAVRRKLRESAAISVKEEIGSPPSSLKPVDTSNRQLSDYDHLAKLNDSNEEKDVTSVYSLAEEWTDEPAQPTVSDKAMPIKKKPPPKPPSPYKLPSPSQQDPSADEPPPPIPNKKSKNIAVVENQEYMFTAPASNNVPPTVIPRERAPPPVRSRSQTSVNRNSQSSISGAPVPIPRRTIPSYSTTVMENDNLSLSGSVTSDSPFTSPPPRPPKSAAMSFKDSFITNPPAIPPKLEPPALPPKPSPKQESNYPNVPPRSNRPPVNR